jgi:hypothetical protein
LQATRNTRFENIPTRSIEFPNKHLAPGSYQSQNSAGSELTCATTRVSVRRSALAGAYQAETEMRDRIESWVNEGGAGGEPDESTSRPRCGG